MGGGTSFLSEVREQPDALRRLLEHADEVCAIGARIAERSPQPIRLVAHGSSDNAASFGVYAFGIASGRTAFRDSISLTTYYEAEVDIEHSVVVALSRSGRTPDVVEHAERARAGGALTVAVTNDPEQAREAAGVRHRCRTHSRSASRWIPGLRATCAMGRSDSK